MTTVSLREYGTPQWVTLTGREREQLEATSEAWKRSLGLPSAPLKFESKGELVGIAAQGVAGTMRVGDIRIEIAPKFLDPEKDDQRDWRQAFWQILIIAQEGKSLFGRAVGTDASTMSIADLLAEIFLRSYARGTTRGLPLRYAEVVGTSPSVRGAFDVARFGEWIAEPWRVPTKETVLTPDTPLARLLGWAAAQLRTVTSSKGRARELDTIRHALPGWGRDVPKLDVAERLQLGIQHEALRPAFEVALLLLRGHGIKHGDGDRDVIGFLWRSEDIYERFLFWLCREAGRTRGLLVRKTSAQFGISSTAPPLTTTPDVMFARPDGDVAAVLDAKYKNLNATPKASDSYQILTSANHFGCAEVGLVYPSTYDRPASEWTVASQLGGDEVTISSLHIDLLSAGSADGRRELVEKIGSWLDGLGLSAGRPDLEAASA